MFDRPRHNTVLKVLKALDASLFQETGCYFAGGTAIVLLLGEYRESLDVDFLCASETGYRSLRQAIWGKGVKGLLRPGAEIEALRDLRADQYGLRTVFKVDDLPVKFEIVREARIDLTGAVDPAFQVPVLARDDMYAEKLLANTDRWNDSAVLSRDIIDLSLMISRWGPIPQAAWHKARTAYGSTVDSAYAAAIAKIQDYPWLQKCMSGMAMDRHLMAEILAPHEAAPDPETAENSL